MTAENVEISEATVVDDRLVAAFARLIPQLSNSNPPPDAAALEAIVASDTSVRPIAPELWDLAIRDSISPVQAPLYA